MKPAHARRKPVRPGEIRLKPGHGHWRIRFRRGRTDRSPRTGEPVSGRGLHLSGRSGQRPLRRAGRRGDRRSDPRRAASACSRRAPAWSSWPATPPRPSPCAACSRPGFPANARVSAVRSMCWASSCRPSRRPPACPGATRPSARDEKIEAIDITGVFCTAATAMSRVYEIEIDKRREDIAVFSEPCPGLAGLIELGAPAEELEVVVRDHVDALRRRIGRHPDKAMLGCTHYEIVADVFRRALPDGVPADPPAHRRGRLAGALFRPPPGLRHRRRRAAAPS